MKIKKNLGAIHLIVDNSDAHSLISLLNNLLNLSNDISFLCLFDEGKASRTISFYCSISYDDDYITLTKNKIDLILSTDTIKLFIYKLRLFLVTGYFSPSELCDAINHKAQEVSLYLIAI